MKTKRRTNQTFTLKELEVKHCGVISVTSWNPMFQRDILLADEEYILLMMPNTKQNYFFNLLSLKKDYVVTVLPQNIR
jgi:hypothetical protein